MKIKASGDSLQAAKEYAFLLLKYRLRSEKEIRERLKRKKISEQTIEATVRFLNDKGFINDQDFTGLWIASRIKKPLGIRRIKQELRNKGIDADSIEQQFADLKETYSEEEVVREIVRRKMEAAKRLDPYIAKRRLYAYLLRRGFSPDIVIDALTRIQ